MAAPDPTASSRVSATMLKVLFKAAAEDDLSLFEGLVTVLDDGRGHPRESIELLRSQGVEGLEGLGVLHAAASTGSLEICVYLIEHLLFDVNALDHEGRTPLFLAVLKGVDTAKYLLTQGADPNKATMDGISPLHLAAGSGDTEAVELLLEYSAYVDAVGSCGTPLHCAATKNYAATIVILLNYNADFSIMVNDKTPLAAARDAGSADCMLLLSRVEEVSKGSDHTKKRLFEPGTDNNAALDSEIFSECCGQFPEEIFQRQRAFKRPRADLSELSPEAGGVVMVQGFVQSASKKAKKLALVVLRDGPRTLKCVVSADMVGTTDYMVSFAGKLERESYVEVHGEPRLNDTSHEIELSVRNLYCITRALPKLPFPLEDAARGAHVKFNQNMRKLPHVALNTRLDNRFLDLRTNPTRSIFRIQSAVTLKFIEIMASSDFMMMHSPKITSEISSDGGSAVFKLLYPNGKTAALAQSPQLYKQMAINGGYKKVFEIGPVFRAEKSKTHRHLCEYIGLHAEMEIDENYLEVCYLVGSIFVRVFDYLKDNYQEEINHVREQYPCTDLKYLPKTVMLKYTEGIQMLKNSGFKIEEFDDLNNIAEKKLGKLVLDRFGTDFFILYEYPLALRPFYTMPCAEKADIDPGHRYSNSFDAFIRGEEVLSGSQRIHNNDFLIQRMTQCKLDPDSFWWFTDSFKCGAPPRGGFGAGLERLVMLYLGLPEIKMASMFPRDCQRFVP